MITVLQLENVYKLTILSKKKKNSHIVMNLFQASN